MDFCGTCVLKGFVHEIDRYTSPMFKKKRAELYMKLTGRLAVCLQREEQSCT